MGNITGIYRFAENEKVYYNRYYYDEANQIVREDNRLGGFTSVYTYDVGGNIVSRIRYPYTEGDIQGLTATETHTYSYENPLWGDVLTAYNGQPVTYDAMGNITSLEGDTYIWTAGRQLSRIIKADNSYIDYFYDDNGQLSMYKTYKADNTLDGGAEYFWDGTTLIAVRLIENDTDGMTAFMRILYDSDGEPLGFLLNDAMPFLYTKNLLGDITGVVNYENAQLMFSYAYDAYGNYELIPPDDSAASMVVSTMLHALNPLTYRGYVFTPALGISHYLGSRFYSPTLCRFMNADVYADTAQGVVGTNMFAYCNNNPVMFVDPCGTSAFSSFKMIVQKTIKLLKQVLNTLGVYYDFSIIIDRHLYSVVKFEEYKDLSKSNSYELKIDLTVKFNNKTFSEYIYDRFKQVKDDVFDELAIAILSLFENEKGREFLFSDNCVTIEIKQHIEAYWWSVKQVKNKNLLANICTVILDKSAKEIEERCQVINILEAHPVIEGFTEEIFFTINGTPFGFKFREQELMFDYYSGIRKIYYKTIHDPYYNINTKKRDKYNAYQNEEWRM